MTVQREKRERYFSWQEASTCNFVFGVKLHWLSFKPHSKQAGVYELDNLEQGISVLLNILIGTLIESFVVKFRNMNMYQSQKFVSLHNLKIYNIKSFEPPSL